jgi:hypothetical protein
MKLFDSAMVLYIMINCQFLLVNVGFGGFDDGSD